jgi:predicted DNA-binding protein YlxM (UPF0122 family)
MDLYYNYDLSLSEIAEHFDISRQGVYDLIKRSEQILFRADNSIGMLKLRNRVLDGIRDIEQDIEELIDQLDVNCVKNPDEIKERLRLIKGKVVNLRSL